MDPTESAAALFRVLETGDPALASQVVAAGNHNSEAVNGPAACQLPGPAGALASSAWLRSAFPDLRFAVGRSVADGDQVWIRMRMQGRHTGAFVRFRDGQPDQVVPPTGREIDSDQIHLMTVVDGRIVGHEALRDELGLLGQLGLFPPTPATLGRMLLWKVSGRAQRAAAVVSDLAAQAAAQLPTPR